ncbi:MFS transporter, partial [Candidatus Omnitrophota bacterium]
MTSGAFSLRMLFTGLLSMVMGKLNDRFGPRLVVTASGFFIGLGFLLMSQISTIWQLYLFFGVIVAIGISGSLIPMVSTVARWFVRRRGLMTGIAVSGGGFGTLVMPLLASYVISNYGWRTSYTIMGVIAIV